MRYIAFSWYSHWFALYDAIYTAETWHLPLWHDAAQNGTHRDISMLYRCVCLATGGQTSVETESVKRLGITRSSHDDIKKAYRKKAMINHPGQENIIETNLPCRPACHGHSGGEGESRGHLQGGE